jgi:hypothetical protein
MFACQGHGRRLHVCKPKYLEMTDVGLEGSHIPFLKGINSSSLADAAIRCLRYAAVAIASAE